MPTAVDLNELYDASYRRLVVQIFAICGNLAEAEDAVQDAFVTALRKKSRLSAVSNPEAWVRAVALNGVRHGWRHASVVRRYQARTVRDMVRDLDSDAAERSVLLKGDGRADSSGEFHYSDGMGQQMGLDLKKGVSGVDGVAPVGPGDMLAEDVHGRPFVFEPPLDYTDQSGVAWLVQWLDDETVVVLSPLRQRTDLLTCHLDTHACEVAASAPTGIVTPDFGKSEFIGT